MTNSTRYGLIMAGGSGTRLWPMSRAKEPKQLLPFIGGRSLLQLSVDRLEGLLPSTQLYVGAAERHREVILRALPGMSDDQYVGEPIGRDTLNAVGLAAAIIARKDPDSIMGVFTSDHIIEPMESFRRTVAQGFELAERSPETLVTFGIAPTAPATGYGYLELSEPLGGGGFAVGQFREKPAYEIATEYLAAGPDRYLWNSGMFVWRTATLLSCIERYEPSVFAALRELADAWYGPQRASAMAAIFPTLKKISIDFAVMEPASRDPAVRVAALPMSLDWLDVGSWPTFARTCDHDERGNALGCDRAILYDTDDTLVVSDDPNHLITTIGCEGLMIIHTADATLVCRADRAEAVKEIHRLVGERFGPDLL